MLDTLGFIVTPGLRDYTLNGMPLPGITSVLDEVLGGFVHYGPRSLDYYRSRGKAVHEATVLWDQNAGFDLNLIQENGVVPAESIRSYIRSWAKLFEPPLSEQYPFVFEQAEAPGYDPKFLIAGTADRIGSFCGDPCIVDIKTGEPDRWKAAIQTIAYAKMHFNQECLVVKRFCVRLHPDGSAPAIIPYENNMHDYLAYQAVATLYGWMKEQRS